MRVNLIARGVRANKVPTKRFYLEITVMLAEAAFPEES
jgi:hypothetical protein